MISLALDKIPTVKRRFWFDVHSSESWKVSLALICADLIKASCVEICAGVCEYPVEIIIVKARKILLIFLVAITPPSRPGNYYSAGGPKDIEPL